MNFKKAIPFVLCAMIQFGLLVTANAQDDATGDSASIVVENALVAMGGREYLSTIRTLYTDMSLQTEGKAIHWIKKEMLPNKSVFKVVNNDNVVFSQCFNGSKGFELLNSNKFEQEAEELKDKKKQKNIFPEFDYLNPALWKVEMAGQQKINGEDCYRIKVVSHYGNIKYLSYSKKKFYKLAEEIPLNAVQEKYKTTIYGGYKKYGKLVYYSTMQTDNTSVAKMEKLLTNQEVSNADFRD